MTGMNAMKAKLPSFLPWCLVAVACHPAPLAEAPPPPPAPDPIEQLEDDGELGPPRDPSCPDSIAWVATVRSRVVDPQGVGLADARVQLCVWTDEPRMLCLEPGRTDEHGDVLIEVAEAARCMVSATARVLLPQSRRPALYCSVELSAQDASLTVPDPYVLLEAPAPVHVPALGDETATREVDLGGVRVEATPEAIGAEEYGRMAAARLTLDEAPGCLAAAAPDFDALVAFAPEVDVEGAGFSFSVDNTLGLDAGDRVELFVQGAIDCRLEDGTLLEKGLWHALGDAVVDDSGASIEGQGESALPCLGWVGLRR